MKVLIRSTVNAVAATLCLFAILANFHKLCAGQFTALGTLLFYLLLFFLFIVRCPSEKTCRKFKHWFFAFAGTFVPLLLIPQNQTPEHLLWIALPIQLVGMFITLVSVWSLGRGFGIAASKRKIKTRGPYRLVRHPLYTGEAIWFLSIVIMNLSIFNILLFCVEIGCQVQRMKEEETLLKQDEIYSRYFTQVNYRMIPKVY